MGLVLFGGYGSSGPLADTWVYNGTTWSQLSPSASPSARYGFTFAAEDLGGNGHRNVMLDLWSGDVWVKRTPKMLATV